MGVLWPHGRKGRSGPKDSTEVSGRGGGGVSLQKVTFLGQEPPASSRLENRRTEHQAWLMCVPRASQVPSEQEQGAEGHTSKSGTRHVKHWGQGPTMREETAGAPWADITLNSDVTKTCL